MRNIETKRAERLPAVFQVEMTWQELVSYLMTRNISDTGIFLEADGNDVPEVGEKVSVRLKGNLGDDAEPPTLTMKVMRKTEDGIGLMFWDD